VQEIIAYAIEYTACLVMHNHFLAGVYYTASLMGPAVGYVLGGQLLKIYTDFLTNDPTE